MNAGCCNREPLFTNSSEVFRTNFHQTIEVGTYVTFYKDVNLLRGCIVEHQGGHVTINRYLTRIELREELGSAELLPAAIGNRFISVDELFRSSHSFLSVPVECVNGIIFVFKTSQFFDEPYEGSTQVFCLMYEIDDENVVTAISESTCLPFPCSYNYFPPDYVSYSGRIHQYISELKEMLTRILCRTLQQFMGNFTKGSKVMPCGPEFWHYIKSSCHDIQVHGPFETRRKSLKMRHSLDLCGVGVRSQTKIIRIETVSHFHRFDSIFRKYSRYGTM